MICGKVANFIFVNMLSSSQFTYSLKYRKQNRKNCLVFIFKAAYCIFWEKICSISCALLCIKFSLSIISCLLGPKILHCFFFAILHNIRTISHWRISVLPVHVHQSKGSFDLLSNKKNTTSVRYSHLIILLSSIIWRSFLCFESPSCTSSTQISNLRLPCNFEWNTIYSRSRRWRRGRRRNEDR